MYSFVWNESNSKDDINEISKNNKIFIIHNCNENAGSRQ